MWWQELPGEDKNLELKDLPTVFIYGVDQSILYLEKEIVEPVKRVITGEKVSPDIPASRIFPGKIEQVLSTPYYELSGEEKKELNKSSWWVWLLIIAVIVILLYYFKIVRL